MPSDSRVQSALAALQRPVETFRSYVASARDRVRAMLSENGGVDRARLQLGGFGLARIDAARFAGLQHGTVLDALSRSRLERADAVLAEMDAASDERFVAEVPSGDSLRVVVARAFTRTGRAFGAANAADLVRAGRYEPERHDRMLESYPYEWWSKIEREHAPPLVVSVDSADLRAGALAELLDVGTRLVIVVDGPSTPAPLVRLVTPGTLVMQTKEADALRRVADSAGPAIAALFDHEAALFTHDPLAGAAVWQRLTIHWLPSNLPKKVLGGVSPRQQREELLQLEAMAAKPALPNGPVDAVVPAGSGDAAERLTAWLLSESGFVTGS